MCSSPHSALVSASQCPDVATTSCASLPVDMTSSNRPLAPAVSVSPNSRSFVPLVNTSWTEPTLSTPPGVALNTFDRSPPAGPRMWRDAMRSLAKNRPGSAPARRQAPNRDARGDQTRKIMSLGAVESPVKLEPGENGSEVLPNGRQTGLKRGFAQPSWPSISNTSTTAIVSSFEE